EPNSENVGVLAVVLLSWRIRQQAIAVVPTRFSDCIHGSILSLAIALHAKRITQGGLQFDRITKRFDVLQRDHRGASIGVLRRHAEAKIFSPIHKRPPRNLPEKSVLPLLANEPIEYGPCARELRFHKVVVPAIQPEIVDHSDPK